MVEGEGFEPSKAEPSDLQSDPFDRSGTPPNETGHYLKNREKCQRSVGLFESNAELHARHLTCPNG